MWTRRFSTKYVARPRWLRLAVSSKLSDVPQAKISAIKKSKTEPRSENTAKSLEAKKFRALLVGATRFQCLSLCLNLLTDICFVIFVPFWVCWCLWARSVQRGELRGKQSCVDCCHCRLTARTVINNCVFLALFAMNYIRSALQIRVYTNTCKLYTYTHTRKDIDWESRGT